MSYIQTDRDKVYGIILNLSGELDLVKTIEDEQRRNIFIDYVKEFIRLDMSNDFFIEFKSDYTAIRKIKKK